QGIQGVEGPTGPTGPTGATAMALTTRGSFYSTAGGTIETNGILPLDTTDPGTTADLTLANNTITIATTGVYLVNYYYTPNS
ncbi:collagen-like protein, partial [Bacillus anthracis]